MAKANKRSARSTVRPTKSDGEQRNSPFGYPYSRSLRQRYAVLEQTEEGLHAAGWPMSTEKGGTVGGPLSGSALARMMSIGEVEELTKPYLESLIGYVAMHRKAEALASTPLRIYASEDKDAPEVTSGELYNLLRTPNSLTTPMELWECMSIFTDLAGGAIWVLLDGSGAPVQPGAMPAELWPIRFDLVRLVPDENGMPMSWAYTSASGERTYQDHATARLTTLDPHDPLGAQGPTSPAYRAMQRLYTLDTYTQGLLEDGGDPGGILTSQRQTTKEQRDELRESVDEKHRVAGAGRKSMMLPNGVDYKSFAFSPKDMEFLGMHDVDVDQTLAAYGVTRSFVGLARQRAGSLGDSGGAVESEQTWVWKNTLIPTQSKWEDQIRSRLIARRNGSERNYVVRFDRSGVEALRPDLGAKLEQMDKLVRKLGRSWNEAAAIVGLEGDQVEGGDVRYVPEGVRTQEELEAELAAAEAAAQPSSEKAVTSERIEVREVKDTRDWQPGDGDAEFEGTGLVGEARWEYAEKAFAAVEKGEKQIERKAARVIEQYLREQEKHLNDVAGKGKGAADHDGSELEVASTRKLVTEAEVQKLLLKNQQVWNELMFSQTSAGVTDVFVGGATSVAGELGVGVGFNRTHPTVLAYLDGRHPQIAETMVSLRNDVRRALIAGLEGGPSVGSLRARVSAVLDELQGSLKVMRNNRGARALLIARTEGASAMNTGRVEQMEEAEVEAHEWLTSRDEAVRVAHRQVDGEVRQLDQSFSNGMRYPGDPNADISLIANERCSTAPVRRRQKS